MEKVTKIKLFLPILSLLPKGKLLDVGCSYGNFLLIAKNKGFEVYGMEVSETAVEIARKKYNLNVVKALTFDELLEDFKGPYKVITAFEVIEHIEKPLKFLQGVYNLLDNTGFFSFLVVSIISNLKILL